ncbi:MAG TPA: DsbA family protein [Stellaceae bacterium]|nr:DsbA family protein [Stellaceae bacterium]
MRKIWLALAAFALLGGIIAAAPARAAGVPQQTPDDRVLGKADAPVTIFEFFSLTCPHCAEFEDKTYPLVKKEWVDTGKAKIVYRDYPLDQNALKAAVIARCAPPDRYAAFVEVLFAQQGVWGVQRDPTEALKRIALLGGISTAQADKCLADQDLSKSIVGEEYQAQKQYGVDSTPTFFINGKKLVGAAPYQPPAAGDAHPDTSDWYVAPALSEAYAAATKHGSAATGTKTAAAQPQQ